MYRSPFTDHRIIILFRRKDVNVQMSKHQIIFIHNQNYILLDLLTILKKIIFLFFLSSNLYKRKNIKISCQRVIQW